VRNGKEASAEREHDPSIVAALSELAAVVQRQRSVDAVLETAGRGVRGLDMRLAAFQLTGTDLVLRHVGTSAARHAAIEQRIGRPLLGLSAPAAEIDLVLPTLDARRILFRRDLDLFATFLRRATGYDPSPLDTVPETRGVTTGLLAPLFVRDRPWGLLGVYSRALTRADTDAVALFATHVGSALEVAESLEALARAQSELVKRERLAALGELAAVVAHEVRNPLGVLFNSIGSLRTIVDAGAPAEKLEDARTLLTIASEEAHRLNRIVSDLLQFVRPYEMALLPCSVADLLRDVVNETSHARRIHVDVEPDLPLVDMDAGYMRQALLNLLLNALQAQPAAGDVTVRASAEERAGRSSVRIDITDTGPGIPPSVRSAMFEPFFTTKATGTGLGLAIVKRIVDAHGGHLDCDSKTTGTTFSVSLPVESEARWLLAHPPSSTAFELA
jgi:signal transduction histidine kinase